MTSENLSECSSVEYLEISSTSETEIQEVPKEKVAQSQKRKRSHSRIAGLEILESAESVPSKRVRKPNIRYSEIVAQELAEKNARQQSAQSSKRSKSTTPASVNGFSEKSSSATSNRSAVLKKESYEELEDIDNNIESYTKAIVTGYPLEALPPSKSHRDKLKNSTHSEGFDSDGDTKSEWDRSLQTRKSDDLTSDSKIRNGKGRAVLKLGHELYNEQPVSIKRGTVMVEIAKISENLKPVTTMATTTPSPGPGQQRKSLLRKHTPTVSPRTNGAFGYGGPMDLSNTPRSSSNTNASKEDNNEDFCSACGDSGSFLCCESCPRSFHFSCLDPPLNENELPEGDWFCDSCLFKQNRERLSVPKGLFGKLLFNLEKKNPHRFELPKKLREFYAGVSIEKSGEYKDDDSKSLKTVQKGVFQQAEPVKVFTKNGEPYFCYHCGGTAINGKELIQCEYCSLRWHLDCLNPPVSASKTSGSKWKCPNHVDDLVKNKRRRLKNPVEIDVSVSHGFKNDGNVEIKQEDLESTVFSEIFESRKPVYLTNTEVDSTGIKSKVLPEFEKNFYNDEEIVYKIDETAVLKDFINRLDLLKEQELQNQNKKVLRMLDTYTKDEVFSVKELLKLQQGTDTKIDRLCKAVEIDQNEMEELKNIKSLILMKGKDELMKFLKS